VRLALTVDEHTRIAEVVGGSGRYRVAIDGQVWEVDARLTAQGICSLLIGGVCHVVDVQDEGGVLVVEVAGERYEVRVEEETRHVIRTRGGAGAAAGGQVLTAPMPGRVTRVAVRVGDVVAPGATLLVIEAMKMENEFKARTSGTVREVRVAAGQAVNPGDVLLRLE
jgi:pyruvate carboxylase subunit B